MPIQAAQGGQDWHGYHPGAGRSRSNRCATNFPVGTAIALPAQRLSRRRERRLVADAAYHRRPYFTGAFRARATSQPLATLRDMLTLPILFDSAAGTPVPATGLSYTIWTRIASSFTKIFREIYAPCSADPIRFIRPSTMSPITAISSAVKA